MWTSICGRKKDLPRKISTMHNLFNLQLHHHLFILSPTCRTGRKLL